MPTRSAGNRESSLFLKKEEALPLSLEELDQKMEAEERARLQNRPADSLEKEPIAINENDFEQAFRSLVEQPQVTDQHFLLTALKQSEYAINENKFLITVGNDAAAKKLESERDFIVSFLRERTGNPTIVMEIATDERYEVNDEIKKMILSSDEKKRTMAEKNPALLLLEQLFNTQMT